MLFHRILTGTRERHSLGCPEAAPPTTTKNLSCCRCWWWWCWWWHRTLASAKLDKYFAICSYNRVACVCRSRPPPPQASACRVVQICSRCCCSCCMLLRLWVFYCEQPGANHGLYNVWRYFVAFYKQRLALFVDVLSLRCSVRYC